MLAATMPPLAHPLAPPLAPLANALAASPCGRYLAYLGEPDVLCLYGVVEGEAGGAPAGLTLIDSLALGPADDLCAAAWAPTPPSSPPLLAVATRGGVALLRASAGGLVRAGAARLPFWPRGLAASAHPTEPGAWLLAVAGSPGVVVFEVRGLHDAADVGADRCAEANVVDHWLFWGESDPVDLATLNDDGGAIATRVFVDCRDCGFDCPAGDCFGCQGIGETCPATLPTSFCVPGVAFRCDKRCEEDGDCFEGARRCDDGTCDTLDETGELCSPCVLNDDVVDGCNEGFACVGPPGATQGFCAMSCPDNFCPDGTRCNRVGNNLSIIGG